MKSAGSKQVRSYHEFLRYRGINNPQNPIEYFRVGIIDCWAEPGFHKFWRKWNPGVGYLAHRLYIRLGGSNNLIFATMIVFIVIGFVHDLVGILLTGKLSPKSTIIFVIFGILTLISRSLEGNLRLEERSSVVNVGINLGLSVLAFNVGARLNSLLFT